ncbi:MAG: ABC transporter substrate-binding protein, partial [Actinomycetes bacterium]
AYAVAEAMGFSSDQVEWTFSPFGKLFAPGDKNYDFALNQISITPARQRAVTFSDPYYEAANAVLVLKDSPYASATTLAELQDAKIGVQAATTAQLQVEADIQPTQDLAVYPSSSNASQALKNGQIDAFITDLPTAIYLALPFNVDGTVVGQLPKQQSADTWGLVLQKDNPIVGCVNQALAKITADGTLEAITTKWMTDYTKAPVLQ